ncbi:F-box/FBD/LRR-repeat protein At5g53840-like [Silene latifolia]|uniref:F-box/FBD/LRR-repeat protein At5g53840-like n=1 Tax=Silene latifolia TaxID=37657 RepID=UPI003D780E88
MNCLLKSGLWRNMKNEEMSSDRLSGLPEHLLLEILSRMPLKSAVGTSILSRRWRFLWTDLPDIHLCMDDDFGARKGTAEFFNLIRNNLLPKLNCPSIRKFTLDLGLFNDHIDKVRYQPGVINFNHLGEINFNHLGKINFNYHGIDNDRERVSSHVLECFNRAASNNITTNTNTQLQEFSFNIDGEAHYYCDIFPDLPLSLFQIQSLVVLRLNPWLSVHQDDHHITNAVFNLPNLKILDVFFFSFHTTLLEKLVSSSPSLSHLSFTLRVPGVDTPILSPFTLNLSHPTLTRLDIRLSDAAHVTIDAPNLQQLQVWVFGFNREFLNRVSFLNSPTRLLACTISVPYKPIDQLLLPSNLFSIISTVKSLTLVEKKPCRLIAPITFSRLTHLGLLLHRKLAGLPLLQKCPVLEVLTFDMTHSISDMLSNRLWPLPDSPPQCLVYSVKRIEIFVPAFVDGVEIPLLDLLKCLLATAKALELLKVTVTGPDLSKFQDASFSESDFIKEVLDMPRSSANCRFKFHGLQPTVLGDAINSDSSMTSHLHH